ncbi:MAG: peptidylprolyl isomerase [Cyanobacteriota bacterium]
MADEPFADLTLLTPQMVRRLARFRLLGPYLRQQLLAELVEGLEAPAEELQKAFDEFARSQKIDSPAALARVLAVNLLTEADLKVQLSQPLLLRQILERDYLPKAEARFLERKTQLDRVVYSLLRIADPGLARELYLQIDEGESDFAELAAAHAEGPERATRGVVGPVPLLQAHPRLAERLRTATPGKLMEPFQIENWWLVVRLESYTPATLDGPTLEQMARELFEEWLDQEVQRRASALAAQHGLRATPVENGAESGSPAPTETPVVRP